MNYLKMQCCSCGCSWWMSAHEAEQVDEPPCCPHCRSEPSKEAWERILNGVLVMSDVNKFLRKDGEKGKPLFRVEVKERISL